MKSKGGLQDEVRVATAEAAVLTFICVKSRIRIATVFFKIIGSVPGNQEVYQEKAGQKGKKLQGVHGQSENWS